MCMASLNNLLFSHIEKGKVTADTPPFQKPQITMIISPAGCKILFHPVHTSDTGSERN